MRDRSGIFDNLLRNGCNAIEAALQNQRGSKILELALLRLYTEGKLARGSNRDTVLEALADGMVSYEPEQVLALLGVFGKFGISRREVLQNLRVAFEEPPKPVAVLSDGEIMIKACERIVNALNCRTDKYMDEIKTLSRSDALSNPAQRQQVIEALCAGIENLDMDSKRETLETLRGYNKQLSLEVRDFIVAQVTARSRAAKLAAKNTTKSEVPALEPA
jgi:hypothetical protein